MNSILLVGKRHKNGNIENSGGAIVLFERLLVDFEEAQIGFDVVDLNYRNYSNSRLKAFVRAIFNLRKVSKGKDKILINGSNPIMIQYIPFLLILKLFYKVKIYVRLFGGKFDAYYQSSNPVKKFVIRYCAARLDKVFLETKHLCKWFETFNKNLVWFPNIREKVSVRTIDSYKKGLVFLGHIKEEKGINILLEAMKTLKNNGYKLSIYGPILGDYKPPKEYENYFYEAYKGAIESHEVSRVLSKHDVLVLPTYYKNEGYPGVIIEALGVGLPIISTKKVGIQEMLNSECSILIEEQDVEGLVEAVLMINEHIYSQYRKAAIQQFSLFDSELVMSRIINEIVH